MRAFGAVLVVVLLAGCTSTTTQTEIFVSGRANPELRGSIAIDPPVERSGGPNGEGLADGRVARPTRDLNGPAVFLEGEPTLAMPVLVREKSIRSARDPCGGAVLAVPVGAMDPRRRFDALAYADTRTLVDEQGTSWITDRYVDQNEPENATRMVWAQNLGGGRGWRPDMGESCPTTATHNAILHVAGPVEADVFFSPAGRPAEP